MPRIPGVATKDASLLIRIGYRFARRRFRVVPEPFTVLARHRRLFMTAARHELAAEKACRTMPKSVLELAVYRVAQRLGCSWCVDFGTMLLKHAGLDTERLKHIDDYRTSSTYTHQERLAVAYADAMTTTPVSVTDEQVAELRAEFGDEGVLELTYQIGLENMRARMFSSLDIRDQGFSSGDACRLPEAEVTAERG